MTPAINFLKRAKIPHKVHRYELERNAEAGWGEEAAAAMGVNPSLVFKTLIVQVEGADASHAVAVVPVLEKLDLRAVAILLEAKRVNMANPTDAQRLTGYVPGGISPFAQRTTLPLLLHHSAELLDTMHVSGGRRGVEIEIAPTDFIVLTSSTVAEICKS